jgi:3-hydroxyacyl-[acyl-carrier-protein] dehydratase
MVAELIKSRGNTGKIWAEAFVDGELVAEAEFMFVLVTN